MSTASHVSHTTPHNNLKPFVLAVHTYLDETEAFEVNGKTFAEALAVLEHRFLSSRYQLEGWASNAPIPFRKGPWI